MSDINTSNNSSTTIVSASDNSYWQHYVSTKGENVYVEQKKAMIEKDFIPVKIIYNCPATICYFRDGTKTIVKVADGEEYTKEEGVMACIIKKIFKTKKQKGGYYDHFLKLVKSGYEDTDAIFERLAYNNTLKRDHKKDQWE